MDPDRRTGYLRKHGPAELAPLWIEDLDAEEALRELSGRSGALFRLQEARFLLRMGRGAEARDVLSALEGLPPGLRGVFEELWAAVAESEEAAAEAGEEETGLASRTLAELYLAQGDRDAALATYRDLAALHPGDGELRSRLRALSGVAEPRGVQALEGWLERVRGWRAVRGV